MNHIPKLGPSDQMTVEEFLAFTLTRPDEERWELIEGVPVLNASPTDYHQIVVANILGVLWQINAEQGAAWFVLPGTGTRVPASRHSLPQPDVMVKERAPTGSAVSDDALVILEVLSKSTRKRDAQTKRRLFERTGVREYWLVDPELDTVHVFRPTAEGRLVRVEEFTAEDGGTLTTPLLPGCGIDVRALFRPTL